jgi:hypothetical protein
MSLKIRSGINSENNQYYVKNIQLGCHRRKTKLVTHEVCINYLKDYASNGFVKEVNRKFGKKISILRVDIGTTIPGSYEYDLDLGKKRIMLTVVMLVSCLLTAASTEVAERFATFYGGELSQEIPQ